MTTSESAYQHRQGRLLNELDRHGLDALLLNAGPSLTYLTGLDVHLSERPVVAIFRPEGPPIVVVPGLETGKLERLPFDVRSHAYGEDPNSWGAVFRRAADEARLDYRRVGVEPQRFRVLELRLIEEAAPRAAYIDGSGAVAELRVHKDAEEIDAMRRAVHMAEEALQDALTCVKKGMTEKALASELTARLLARGSASELPFSPIVAFGAASADPHALPSNRTLKYGDLILIDWGANADGYRSDLTRMYSYGTVDEDLAAIVESVRVANEAARAAVRPGATFADIDSAARNVIERAGYGPQFIHRTGHGLGLETHEEPYVRNGNAHRVQSGMTFTIEPGIYLPGRGGARIEDDVVVTDDGAESLSTMERGLLDLQS